MWDALFRIAIFVRERTYNLKMLEYFGIRGGTEGVGTNVNRIRSVKLLDATENEQNATIG